MVSLVINGSEINSMVLLILSNLVIFFTISRLLIVAAIEPRPNLAAVSVYTILLMRQSAPTIKSLGSVLFSRLYSFSQEIKEKQRMMLKV